MITTTVDSFFADSSIFKITGNPEDRVPIRMIFEHYQKYCASRGVKGLNKYSFTKCGLGKYRCLEKNGHKIGGCHQFRAVAGISASRDFMDLWMKTNQRHAVARKLRALMPEGVSTDDN